MGQKATKQQKIIEFLKMFAKEEICDVLASSIRFERCVMSICMTLFEQKSEEILKKMEENAKKARNCKNIMEMAQNHDEYKKLDRQLDRLSKKFDRLH